MTGKLKKFQKLVSYFYKLEISFSDTQRQILTQSERRKIHSARGRKREREISCREWTNHKQQKDDDDDGFLPARANGTRNNSETKEQQLGSLGFAFAFFVIERRETNARATIKQWVRSEKTKLNDERSLFGTQPNVTRKNKHFLSTYVYLAFN